jgi:hypothetical protein
MGRHMGEMPVNQRVFSKRFVILRKTTIPLEIRRVAEVRRTTWILSHRSERH